MKILHTADLHFGKQLHGYSRLAEQAEFVDAFLDLASDERPDLVLLAGDLYDRAVPPAEAVSLLSRLLVGLSLELKLKVVAIAGNHDSPERVGFATDLLRSADLYLAGPPNAPVVTTFDHADGPVDVVAIPYATPDAVRAVAGEEGAGLRGHDQALVWQLDQARARLGRPLGARSIAVAHAFVTGGQESESERTLSVGGTGAVPASRFDGFAYTALGHLHRPQSLGPAGQRERVRFSGSPICYSFSEVTAPVTAATSRETPAWQTPKSVSIVTLDKAGGVALETKTLRSTRGLRIVEGAFDDLLARAAWERDYSPQRADDLLCVRVTDTSRVFDAYNRMRLYWPHMLQVEWPGLAAAANDVRAGVLTAKEQKTLTTMELFERFVAFRRGEDKPMTDAERKAVEAAITFAEEAAR